MRVAAFRVGLPDLDHRIGYGLAFPVVYRSPEAKRTGLIVVHQVGVVI
ncbi:hypothetical protein BH20ACT11_BH20ACT11_04230 [soil metagenome]